MPDTALFTVTCRHCETIILIVSQIRDAEVERLVHHLRTTHPAVRFYTRMLGRLLDHFDVQKVPSP